MSKLRQAPESKNFEDRTGDTPYNNFDKFMINLLMGIGVIDDLNKQQADNDRMIRENEEYTRRQREDYIRQYGTPEQRAKLPPVKEKPLFPEIEAIKNALGIEKR